MPTPNSSSDDRPSKAVEDEVKIDSVVPPSIPATSAPATTTIMPSAAAGGTPTIPETEQHEYLQEQGQEDQVQQQSEKQPPPAKQQQQLKHRRNESEFSQHAFGGDEQRGISDLPDSVRCAPSSRGRFQDEEARVRTAAQHSFVWLAIVNGYSALLVFMFHLISLESLLSIGLSVGLTIFTYYRTEDNASFDGSALDYVLLSFAVITPMTTSIGMAFSRRDRALSHLVAIRATCLELYSAHASWDWRKAGKEDSTGRAASTTTNWLEHSDAALVEILGICHSLSRFLTLPSATRARHRITKQGRQEAEQTHALASKLYSCMLVRFGRLTDLCEVFKAEGLPPNEATRIRQWERMVLEHTDNLRMLKLYRTPQALRSFARLFTVFLPPFYAPSYAEIGFRIGSLGVGITFSVLTSLALTALFETISQMEDPFLSHASLDGVDVESELSSAFVIQCLTMRSHFFRDAKPFDETCVTTTICERLPVKPFKLVSVASGAKPSSKASTSCHPRDVTTAIVPENIPTNKK